MILWTLFHGWFICDFFVPTWDEINETAFHGMSWSCPFGLRRWEDGDTKCCNRNLFSSISPFSFHSIRWCVRQVGLSHSSYFDTLKIKSPFWLWIQLQFVFNPLFYIIISSSLHSCPFLCLISSKDLESKPGMNFYIHFFFFPTHHACESNWKREKELRKEDN